MAKTGKVLSKKELTEAFKEMVKTMVLEEGGKPVEPSGDFEKLKAQIAEASEIITEDDEFSASTADAIEWVLDNLEAKKEEVEEEEEADVVEVKEKKPTKEKKPLRMPKKFEGERTAFGAFKASGAGAIDSSLLAGGKKTLDDIVKETGQKRSRVLSHLYTLIHKKQVVAVTKDEKGVAFYSCIKQ